MDKEAKKRRKGGKKTSELGDSQQKLTVRAGVLKVKRKLSVKDEVPLPQPNFEEEGEIRECPLGELPKKLFKTEDIPPEGRLNINSRIDRLSEIVKALNGIQELEWLKESVFGKLFNLPTRYCEFSGRLVHNMLCRSLVTSRKHEMWFVFGGKPLRFSLKEFAMITGLNCNPLPSKEERKRLQTPEEDDEPYWDTLIGKVKTMTIDGIVRMLNHDNMEPPHKKMGSERRLKLALLVIVEGILCVKSSAIAATKETVEMLKDLDSFCNYPWGRESFELTMRMVSVGQKVKSVETLAGKLHQSHISNHGFTLAYQLLAVYTIPLLEQIIPVKDFDTYFYDPKFDGLAKSKPFHNDNILEAEQNPELIVESLLSTGHSVDDWDLSWDDEVDDPMVDRIYKGLETGYNFSPSDWKVQHVHPIQRHPRARGKPHKGAEAWAGMPGGDSARYDADKLVLEGDRLMDGYFARKHEFEYREEEHLREGFRNLLIRALTMRDHYRQEEVNDEEQLFDDDTMPLRTPMRRVRGGSDIEDIIPEDEEINKEKSEMKPKEKSRKRKGKGKKGKAPREDKASDLSESEEAPSDRASKKTKLTGITDKQAGIGSQNIVNDGREYGGPKDSATEGRAYGSPKGNVHEGHESVAAKVVGIEEKGSAAAKNIDVVGASIYKVVDDVDSMFPHEKATPKAGDPSGSTEPIVSAHENVENSEPGGNASVVGATGELGNPISDINYCSGDESDDEVLKNKESEGQIGDEEEKAANMPLRSTRSRTAPQRFGHTPEEKGRQQSEVVEPVVYDPMGPVSEVKKKALMRALENRRKEMKVLGHEVKKTFFREIYKPKQHVTTQHMEAMLASVWANRGPELLENKVGIMNAWFVQHLVQEHGRYKKVRNPPVPFPWSNAIVNYVAGDLENREGAMRWMVDVDHLYAPMNWNNNHWVALNISLMMGAINILDCNQNLTADTKMPKLMNPVIEILPLILRDLVEPELEAADSFDYTRGIGVSQNERSGDCGPLTVKFIELDGQGFTVEGITDKDVDDLRMKYAIDVFEQNIDPL